VPERGKNAAPFSRQHFSQMKWLAHIIVGYQFETDYSVDRILSSADHDDAASAACMQLTQQIESVFDAEIQIKQDQIVSVLLQSRHHTGSRTCYGRSKSVFGKIPRQHRANSVDEQKCGEEAVVHGEGSDLSIAGLVPAIPLSLARRCP
jgi:hypothetical protein